MPKKIFAVLILPLFCLAAFAQQEKKKPEFTMLPGSIKNFELPNFDSKTGYRDWELFGSSATYLSDEKIVIKDMKLDIYDGEAVQLKKATFTSPGANVNPSSKMIESADTLNVRGEGFNLDGRGWEWNGDKRVIKVHNDSVIKFAQKDSPETVIKSKSVDFSHGGEFNVFTFGGGVLVEREGMKTSCETLTATASKAESKSAQERVKEIIAKGGVKFEQEGKVAEGGLAKIDPEKSQVELFENPKIFDSASKASLSGERILLLQKEGKVQAFGKGARRANAIVIDERDPKNPDTLVAGADFIELRQNEKENRNFFDFKGGVVLTSSQLNARADEVLAEASVGKDGARQVEKLDASGNVVLKREGKIAKAAKLDVLPEKGEFWLTKKASLEDPEKGVKLESDTIILFQNEDTAVAVADKNDPKSRVTATINQGAESIEAGAKGGGKTVVKSGLLRSAKFKDGTVLSFSENVEINSDAAKGTCARMDVYADSVDVAGGKAVVKQIVASDDVVMTQENYRATAQLAYIFPKVEGGAKAAKKPDSHRFVELLISPDKPDVRPSIILPAIDGVGLSEKDAAAAQAAKKETVITSDRQTLVSSESADRYFFEGNVKIEGTDIDGSCKKIEVVIRAKKKGGKEEKAIDRIILTDDVEIRQGMKFATCGRADIYPEAETIILTKKPVVKNDEDNTRAEGTKIVYVNGRKGVTVEGGFEDNFEDEEGSPAFKRPTLILPQIGSKNP